MWDCSAPSAQGRADSQWAARLNLSCFSPCNRMWKKQHPEMSPSSCFGHAPSPPAPFNPHSYTQEKGSLSICGPPGCS